MLKRLLLALTAIWALGAGPILAASSPTSGLTASGAIVGSQLFFCPISGGSNLKCTAAQVAAFSYSLMSGDCTVSSVGVTTCTKTNGTSFSALATTVPGANVATALQAAIGVPGAFIVNGGVLGTPSSGNLANTTGFPTANLSGLGTGVATAIEAPLNSSGGIPAPTPAAAGDIIFWNGTAWVKLAGNASGTQFLQETASGVPSWAAGGGSSITFTTSCPASSTTGSTIPLTNGITFNAEAGTFNITAAQCGNWFDATTTGSTAVPVQLPTSPGSGFYVSAIENAKTSTANLLLCDGTVSSGVCTPTGTIDGASSLSLPPGSSIAVIFDGANYQVTGGVGMDVLFFSTVGAGTYVPNPSLVYADFYCLGGAAGGGSGGAEPSGTAVSGGAGGGGANTKHVRLTAAQVGSSSITTDVAGGGAGGAAVTSAGVGLAGAGAGNTSFAGILTCNGSGAGGPGGTLAAGGGGGGGLLTGGTAGSAGAAGFNTTGGANGNTVAFGGLPGGGAGGGGSLATGLPSTNLGPGQFYVAGGAAGSGVSTALVASNGLAGGSANIAAGTSNAGAAGVANTGVAGGAGASGLIGGILAVAPWGLYAGGAGGSGGGSNTFAGAAGAGGAGGFGVGGSGGGGACISGGTCVSTASGAGGAGGQGALEVWEFMK